MYSVCDLRASCLHPHKANPDTVPTNQAEGVWSACCLCGLPLFGTVGTCWYHLLFYSIVFAAAKMESLGLRDGPNFRIFSGCFQTTPTKLLQNILIHGAWEWLPTPPFLTLTTWSIIFPQVWFNHIKCYLILHFKWLPRFGSTLQLPR